ncbi:glutamate--tRNA ligase [soil metagenome]
MIRTRFAPSPTGSLHVGNARIAVLNWLFTRRHGGTFILRIEDTDIERNVAGAETGMRQDLLWLGLDWDEGPGPGHGSHGPYRQSERGAIYDRYARRLEESGAAYPCFCAAVPRESAAPAESDAATAPAESDTAAALAAPPGETFAERRERCACAGIDAATAKRRQRGEPWVLRFRVPTDRVVAFDDVVRGQVQVATAEIADFVLLRSDGRPTYSFAVVVDDVEMHITHVIRGVGHLSNTPRQVLLFEALGIVPPAFVHVPTVLGPDRQKLSKRHGAAAMSDYRAQGYHPDALLNYLSLLSWSSPSGAEVLSRERLVAEVSLKRIGAADVVFDPVKLRWLSAKHIEMMDIDELLAAVRPCISDDRFALEPARLRSAVAASRTHLATFADINEQLRSFFPVPQDSAEHAKQGSPGPEVGAVIATAARVLADIAAWDESVLKDAIQQIGRETGLKGRALYEPLRHALTGRDHGPPLPAVLFVQGRTQSLELLRSAPGHTIDG